MWNQMIQINILYFLKTTAMTLQKILIALYNTISQLGCGLAGLPYEKNY
jgi:hypothetical protein